MGFALWVNGGLACARGTHEYKPMGIAIISATDLFRGRDFRPPRAAPAFPETSYVGLFASLVDVNHWLKRRNRAATWRVRSP
jgi:hypothetical protein